MQCYETDSFKVHATSRHDWLLYCTVDKSFQLGAANIHGCPTLIDRIYRRRYNGRRLHPTDSTQPLERATQSSWRRRGQQEQGHFHPRQQFERLAHSRHRPQCCVRVGDAEWSSCDWPMSCAKLHGSTAPIDASFASFALHASVLGHLAAGSASQLPRLEAVPGPRPWKPGAEYRKGPAPRHRPTAVF
jgi:hypothetical protein